jgi:methylthioribose-1-phosphate isomerase
MRVRGAPLIGATAAFGLFFALRDEASETALLHAYDTLHATRPTAINLRWALDRVRRVVLPLAVEKRADAAWCEALAICEEDVQTNHAIGQHALELFRAIQAKKADPTAPLNVMTHCNAGWLACVDWGTATSPVYQAHDLGIPVHVWVDETRPRNQGASLTAFELGSHGVPYTLIVDNAGGHYMQNGQVDMCIVGTDRVTANGDVANKIGTYMVAVLARRHGIPFYVACPFSTIDRRTSRGSKIPIEERDSAEVTGFRNLRWAPRGVRVKNPAFDVTPASLVTALITEKGVLWRPNRTKVNMFFRQNNLSN